MKKIIYFLTIFFLLLFIFFVPFVFKIEKIICKTQFGNCPPELESKMQSFRQKSYREIQKNLENLPKDNASIRSYSSQVKLPSSLEVNFTIKNPIFSMSQKNTQNYVFMDAEGNVITIGSYSDLPTITIEEKLPNTGEKINEKYLFALNIMQGLNLMYQINSGEIKNESLVVELPGHVNVIFPLDGRSDLLLGSLRLIYEKIQNGYDGKTFREIDLRYKNPVLR